MMPKRRLLPFSVFAIAAVADRWFALPGLQQMDAEPVRPLRALLELSFDALVRALAPLTQAQVTHFG